MANLLTQALSGLGLSGWNNDKRLLDVVMPEGAPLLLVESMRGVESILGMPIPDAAVDLLPNPALYPAPILHDDDALQHHQIKEQQVAKSLLAGFRYSVFLLSPTVNVDTASWINQPITLWIQTDGSMEKRPFHGFITEASYLGSNGGLARLHIHVESWLSYLRLARHSRTFQHQNVGQIIQTLCEPVIATFAAKLDIASSVFDLPPFALITQYRETDFQFLQRLLQQAGLVAWFSHEASEGGRAAEGSHTLHIVASEQRTSQDGQPLAIRFHRASHGEREDTIQSLREHNQISPPSAQWQVYDERLISPNSWNSHALKDQAESAPFHFLPPLSQWTDTKAIDRIAQHWQAGQQLLAQTIQLTSTVRKLPAMGIFSIFNHHRFADGSQFRVLSVLHEARNNLGQVTPKNPDNGELALDPLTLEPITLGDNHDGSTDTTGTQLVDFYQNQVLVLPEIDSATNALPLACYINTDTTHWLDRPHVRPQTAIVTGSGGPIETERNHRVRIQFHWQRGQAGHQPNSLSEDLGNAPSDQSSSLWVRVGAASTGDHMGSSLIPRVGQEVMVSFLQNDIDQPVVTGSTYNGAGQVDATGSQIQASLAHITSNAPVWSSTANNPDIIRGIKSQSLSLSQRGDAKKAGQTTGYSLIGFDQTPNQWRIELSSTAYQSQAQLGSIRHQNDIQLKEQRGLGFAVETEAAGHIRASQGVLLSSQIGATGQYMQSGGLNQLTEAKEPLNTWQTQADKHKVVGVAGDSHQNNQQQSDGDNPSKAAQAVQDTAEGMTTDTSSQGSGWTKPQVAIESPGLTALITPQHLGIQSTGHIISQSKTLDVLSQQQSHLLAREDTQIFAAKGLRVTAANGRFRAIAHTGMLRLDAKKDVQMASRADVLITAPDTIRLIGGGSAIEIAGGNVTLTSGSDVKMLAGSKKFIGGGGSAAKLDIKQAEMKGCERLGDEAEQGHKPTVMLS